MSEPDVASADDRAGDDVFALGVQALDTRECAQVDLFAKCLTRDAGRKPSVGAERAVAAASAVAAHEDALVAGWSQRHLAQPWLAAQLMIPAEEYGARYVRPMLDLLAGYLRSGDPVYAHVYADERTRMLPDREDGIGSDEETYSLLRDDEAEITAVVNRFARGDVPKLPKAFEALHGHLVHSEPAALNVALVGDCLMTETRSFLAPMSRAAGFRLDTRHFYLSGWGGNDVASDDVVQYALKHRFTLIAFSFLTFEGIPPYRAFLADARHLSNAEVNGRATEIVVWIERYLRAVREATPAPFLLNGACGLPLGRYRKRIPVAAPLSRKGRLALEVLNGRLRQMADATENCVFIDEALLVRRQGLRHAAKPIFPKHVTSSALFHTSRLGLHLARAYLPVASAYARLKTTKVLLVDFDNTLWAGVMAEGPVTHDKAAQRLLRRLREAGIILVSLSRNDPSAIRWSEMDLANDDFALHKISWTQKARSVEEAAQELNLDPSSFALLDDNPVERDLIGQVLPDVTMLDPGLPATWEALEYLLQFPNTQQTAEATARTRMYREAASRREAVVVDRDYDSMMASLELRADVRRAEAADLARVHELLQRTNQFNTTTKRRSKPELETLLSDERRSLHVACLADRFGDLGLVGVVTTEARDDELYVDSVVMSCRAMGFGLEMLMLNRVLSSQAGWRRSVGIYVPSDRNEPCALLFEGAGFNSVDGRTWQLDALDELPRIPSWFSEQPVPRPG